MKTIFLLTFLLISQIFFAQNNQNSQTSSSTFELDSVENHYDLTSCNSWFMAGVPKHQPDLFIESNPGSNYSNRFNCAKLAWNHIDELFYDKNASLIEENIKNDPNSLSSFYVNQLFDNQLFPEHGSINGIPVNMDFMNLSFYPHEKGSFNFDTKPTLFSAGIDSVGNLKSPETRWAGIMRKILPCSPLNRIKYLDFWMMDPFVEDTSNEGGIMYFNIGNISEDLINDGNFDIEENDDGLDNLDDNHERNFFTTYLDTIKSLFGENSLAYLKAYQDPSNDNYHYFLGSDYDQQQLGILSRYKMYNNDQGNSTSSAGCCNTIATSIANTEDINFNQILDTTESYYQYKINISPDNLRIGLNHIVEERKVTTTFPNGITSSVNWYHYKIPLNDPDTIIGDIDSIVQSKFMRIFLKNFSKTTHFRFATLEFTWKEKKLYNNNISVYPNPSNGKFTIEVDDPYPKKILLYDLPGKLIFESDLINEQKIYYDFSRFGDGIYFFKINF